MKPGKPLKRTGFKSPGKPLKRTAWKANPASSMAPRSKQIANRSKTSKRGKEQAQRAEFVAKMIAQAHGLCQAQQLVRMVDSDAAKKCLRLATQVHEPLTRARGGSILDPDNSIPICSNCHRFVHDHPEKALEVGLLRRGR